MGASSGPPGSTPASHQIIKNDFFMNVGNLIILLVISNNCFEYTTTFVCRLNIGGGRTFIPHPYIFIIYRLTLFSVYHSSFNSLCSNPEPHTHLPVWMGAEWNKASNMHQNEWFQVWFFKNILGRGSLASPLVRASPSTFGDLGLASPKLNPWIRQCCKLNNLLISRHHDDYFWQK